MVLWMMGAKIGPQSDPRSELIGLGCNSTCEHSISGNTVTLFHRPVVDIVMLLLITVLITFGPHPDYDICRCHMQRAVAPAFLSGPFNFNLNLLRGWGEERALLKCSGEMRTLAQRAEP